MLSLRNPDNRPLPAGWSTQHDPSTNRWYYTNGPRSTWKHPADLDQAAQSHSAVRPALSKAQLLYQSSFTDEGIKSSATLQTPSFPHSARTPIHSQSYPTSNRHTSITNSLRSTHQSKSSQDLGYTPGSVYNPTTPSHTVEYSGDQSHIAGHTLPRTNQDSATHSGAAASPANFVPPVHQLPLVSTLPNAATSLSVTVSHPSSPIPSITIHNNHHQSQASSQSYNSKASISSALHSGAGHTSIQSLHSRHPQDQQQRPHSFSNLGNLSTVPVPTGSHATHPVTLPSTQSIATPISPAFLQHPGQNFELQTTESQQLPPHGIPFPHSLRVNEVSQEPPPIASSSQNGNVPNNSTTYQQPGCPPSRNSHAQPPQSEALPSYGITSSAPSPVTVKQPFQPVPYPPIQYGGTTSPPAVSQRPEHILPSGLSAQAPQAQRLSSFSTSNDILSPSAGHLAAAVSSHSTQSNDMGSPVYPLRLGHVPSQSFNAHATQNTVMQQQVTSQLHTIDPMAQNRVQPNPPVSPGISPTAGAIAGGVAFGLLGGAIMESVSGGDSGGRNSWNSGIDTTTYTETFVADTYAYDTVDYMNAMAGTEQFTEYDDTQYQITETVSYYDNESGNGNSTGNNNSFHMGKVAGALGHIAQQATSNNSSAPGTQPAPTGSYTHHNLHPAVGSHAHQTQPYAGNYSHQSQPSIQFNGSQPNNYHHGQGHTASHYNTTSTHSTGLHQPQSLNAQIHHPVNQTHAGRSGGQQSHSSNVVRTVSTEIASKLAVKAGVAVGGALIGAIFNN